MRASTLFAITFAILLGLGVAAVARYLGLFDSEKPAPQPVAAVPKPPEPPLVLVAKTNLLEGTTCTPNDVMVRPARPDELDVVNRSKDKLLPALTTAVNLRVLQRNVLADELMLKEHFQELTMPEALSLRLDPDMRAVNVTVTKEQSLGGMVRAGEYVDVFLTSRVSDTRNTPATLRTTCIARQCKVLLKRDSLYTFMIPNPEGQPIHFTLQANPYRAALIEFAQTSGQLSLKPVPMAKMADKPAPFASSESEEFKDDDARVAKLLKGELTIGVADLQRVFALPPLQPLPKPTQVTVLRGLKAETITVPTTDETPTPVAYIFTDPTPPSASSKSSATKANSAKAAPAPLAGGPIVIDAKLGQKKTGYTDPKAAPPANGEKKGL